MPEWSSLANSPKHFGTTCFISLLAHSPWWDHWTVTKRQHECCLGLNFLLLNLLDPYFLIQPCSGSRDIDQRQPVISQNETQTVSATVANRSRVLPLKPHELGLQRLHLSQHCCSPDSCSNGSFSSVYNILKPLQPPDPKPSTFPQAHKPHSETYHTTDPTPGTKLYILITFLIAVTKYRARRDWRKKRFTVWVLEAGKAGSVAWNYESN